LGIIGDFYIGDSCIENGYSGLEWSEPQK
jgi:hypothetical protein